MTVEVRSLLDSSEFAKAGLMIRAGNGRNAAFVLINIFPDATVGYCVRTKDGEAATEKKFYPTTQLPVQLRLQFDRGAIVAQYRVNNETWNDAATSHLESATPMRIGFAVASHDVQTLTTAQFQIISSLTTQPTKEGH